MKKVVVIYTMKTCPFCSEVKEMLKEEGIKFYTRDIDEHKEEYDSFVELTGNDYLPSFSILTLDDKLSVDKYEYMVPEESFQSLEEAVEKIKKHVL